MKVQQIYTGCLAHGAYYIESEGEVAIIDPLREVTPYLDMVEASGSKIKYIFETHFHADFVSGHLTLSEKTGAPIVFGPTAKPDFEATIAEHGQEFPLGNLNIKVLHTPGHTMESACFLLLDEEGAPHSLFTGDTLFLGDVGRPDLAQKAANMTQDELAGLLYESLRSQVMSLPDEVIVYPGHGAGSTCGKSMRKETVGTIGEEKRTNYALRADMSKEEFVKEVTDGLLPPPAYFPWNVMLNKQGYQDVEEVIEQGTKGMAPKDFELAANAVDALVLDVRHQDEFGKGHVPNSIFIGLDGSFAPWVGAMVKDIKHPILLVVAEERLEEAITRLSRVGFDNVIGYLEGGAEAWKADGREVGEVRTVFAGEMKVAMEEENVPVVDVRKESEFASEHVKGAANYPLVRINEFLDMFSEEETTYVHCAGGYRSMIAVSILKSRGIHQLVNVAGGFKAIKAAGLPVTEFVCPTTL